MMNKFDRMEVKYCTRPMHYISLSGKINLKVEDNNTHVLHSLFEKNKLPLDFISSNLNGKLFDYTVGVLGFNMTYSRDRHGITE